MIKTSLLPTPNMRLFLAAGEEPTPEAAKVFREAASTMVTSINSMLDYLDEPLKGQFLKVKTDINTMLAGMPATDQVPAALESNYMLRNLMSVLGMAQSMMTTLSETAKQANGRAATALNSITVEVEKAVEGKLKAGELLKSADLQAKIDAAVTTAREGWASGQKRVTDRRTLLTTASLPVPGDDVLAVEEKDFSAKHDQAKARAEKLKGFKVEGAQLTTLCWDVSQAEFDRTVGLLQTNASTVVTPPVNTPPARKPGASPFIASTNIAARAELRPKVGCV